MPAGPVVVHMSARRWHFATILDSVAHFRALCRKDPLTRSPPGAMSSSLWAPQRHTSARGFRALGRSEFEAGPKTVPGRPGSIRGQLGAEVPRRAGERAAQTSGEFAQRSDPKLALAGRDSAYVCARIWAAPGPSRAVSSPYFAAMASGPCAHSFLRKPILRGPATPPDSASSRNIVLVAPKSGRSPTTPDRCRVPHSCRASRAGLARATLCARHSQVPQRAWGPIAPPIRRCPIAELRRKCVPCMA